MKFKTWLVNFWNFIKSLFVQFIAQCKKHKFFMGIWVAVVALIILFGFLGCSSTVDVRDNATVGSISSSASIDNFSEGI